MRYLIASIIAMTFVFGTSMAQTKQKYAHINSQDLLELMPEKVEADKKLEGIAAQLEKQLSAMSKEWETKIQDYRANEAEMSDIIAQTKAEEIQSLEQRIQNFQKTAQQNLAKEEAKVYQPVLDKARAAIESVSEKNGYSYVFDSSSGALLYQPESDDIMEEVKKELGITPVE